MLLGLLVVGALVLTLGCVASRPYRDVIPGGGGEIEKAALAAEIDRILDAAAESEGESRVELLRSRSEALSARIGTESDAGLILAEGLRGSPGAADLEATLERTLDALDFEVVVEAELPAGFPEPSVPGLVRVKRYPTARMARVSADDSGRNSMFMELFRHIERNEIAMTAPVDMALEDGDGARAHMAFYYGSTGIGRPGAEGSVEVLDAEPITVVSVGVRGGYSEANFREALARLETWLTARGGRFTRDGEPRVLAYNSPFVPWFLKYSEVQIPVREL
jgi:hypothetical protein